MALAGTAAMPTPALQPPLPSFLQLEPVGRCNLSCRMCAVHERGDEVAELPLERFVELLDAMPQLQSLHLQGLGEPMLHPRFFDMVAIAAARGLHVSANSNLTLLSPARAERCVTSGLAALSVSIDGASAAVYEHVRRGARFPRVMRNLRRLTAARDAAGSALAVRGVMVLMRANLPELPALVRLLHDHGVHELLVQRLASELDDGDDRYIPIRRYVESAELQPADLGEAERVFAQARDVAAGLGFSLHLPRLLPRADAAPRCRWPWEQLYITAAGEMLPCCMVATADRARFGRVFSDDAAQPADPRAVWQGDAARDFRAALDGDEPPAVCRGCALYTGRF